MGLRCVAAFTGVIVLALPGIAAAQMPGMGPLPTFENAPAAPPPGTGMAPPGAGPPPGARPPPQAGGPGGPQGEPPPCVKEFLALRAEAQKKASVINAAQHREPKPTREEMCQVIKTFAAAEAKVVKYAVDHQASCGVPPEAVAQMKADQTKTVKFRTMVCSGGPAAPGAPGAPQAAAPPPGPKLSDELGFRGLGAPTEGASGRGTFDTLTGNALQR